MKKRIFPICLSFLISAAYVASGIYFVSCVIKNPGPNYAMLWIPQAVFSAADYAVLGVLLCRNKADKIAVTVSRNRFLFCNRPACVYTDVVYVFSYVSLQL